MRHKEDRAGDAAVSAVTTWNRDAARHPRARVDRTAGGGPPPRARLAGGGGVFSGPGWRSGRCRRLPSLEPRGASGRCGRAPWGFREVWPCRCSFSSPFCTLCATPSSPPVSPVPGRRPRGLSLSCPLCPGTVLAHGHQRDISLCRRVFAIGSQNPGCPVAGRHAGQIHFIAAVWPRKEIDSLC